MDGPAQLARRTPSAGQRRKLAAATALLLDEPSNTLDLAALDDLRALLEQARERCVVVATRNLERLGLELDRTLIARDGRVEAPAVGVTGQAAPRGPGSS